jgi:hypothetical protein
MMTQLKIIKPERRVEKILHACGTWEYDLGGPSSMIARWGTYESNEEHS